MRADRFARTAIWAAAAALLTTACGSATEQEVTEVARGFLEAVAGGDAETGCALLAPAVLDRMRSTGQDCGPSTLSRSGSPSAQVRETQVWGDNALVRTDSETMFLVELADGWRVTGAGCRPDGEQSPYQCRVGG